MSLLSVSHAYELYPPTHKSHIWAMHLISPTFLSFNSTVALHTCAAVAAAAAADGPNPGGGNRSGASSNARPWILGGARWQGLDPAVERTAAQRHKDELHTLNVGRCHTAVYNTVLRLVYFSIYSFM